MLGGILLRAENGELHLAATDMELSLRTSLEAQVEGEGAVVVPGKVLVDLVRLLPDEEVTIEHRAGRGRRSCRMRARTARGSTRTPPRTFRACPRSTTIGTFTVDTECAARHGGARVALGVA